MKAKLQKIGNSKGIRIPKAILDEIGFETAVELTVEGDRLIVSPIRSIRLDWEAAFQKANQAEALLIDDGLQNDFDETEWTW